MIEKYPRAHFLDEMEAELWMMNNVLENGFYEKKGEWYTVYEWVEVEEI